MKPIKDTKLGAFLKEKAPKVLDVVGDLLPDRGALGILKNLISSDPDIPAADKLEFQRIQYDFEIELHKLEMQDLQSARTREADVVKATGHMDYFMYFFGTMMIGLFIYTTYVSSTGNIPADMREIFIEGRAAVRDIVLGIAAYYWGSSAGSRIKDMKKS